MTFKPGDKVRYKDSIGNTEWHGWEGTVQAVPGYATRALTTNPTDAAHYGTEVHLITDNLELITPPEPVFTFADIQVGDKIRRTYTRPSGTTEVREGVVTDKEPLYAVDRFKGGSAYILAYDSDGDPTKQQVKLELLERPEPPHWTETKPVGSVGVVLFGEHTKTITKERENRWRVVYAISGNEFTRSSKEMVPDTITLAQETKLTWIK